MAGRWNNFLNRLLGRGAHTGRAISPPHEPAKPVPPPIPILPPNPPPNTPIGIIYGDDYWKRRAIELLREMDVEFFYGTDHVSQSNWLGATNEEYMQIGEEHGYQTLVRNLLIKKRMQDLYWQDAPGDRDEATEMWLDRDEEDLPYWFWSYHGIYA